MTSNCCTEIRQTKSKRIRKENPQILFMAAFELRAEIKTKYTSIFVHKALAFDKVFAINWIVDIWHSFLVRKSFQQRTKSVCARKDILLKDLWV